MSARSVAAVGELREAADALRANAPGNALSAAVAELLLNYAEYWTKWFPEAPQAIDLSIITIARTILAARPQTPDADSGSRQQITPNRKEA
jgi:hypothetical protein